MSDDVTTSGGPTSDGTDPSELIDTEVVVLTAADGSVYALRAGQLEAFRLPDEEQEGFLAEVGDPEVAGFSLSSHGSLRIAGTTTISPTLALPGDVLLPPAGRLQPDVAFPGNTC